MNSDNREIFALKLHPVEGKLRGLNFNELFFSSSRKKEKGELFFFVLLLDCITYRLPL